MAAHAPEVEVEAPVVAPADVKDIVMEPDVKANEAEVVVPAPSVSAPVDVKDIVMEPDVKANESEVVVPAPSVSAPADVKDIVIVPNVKANEAEVVVQAPSEDVKAVVQDADMEQEPVPADVAREDVLQESKSPEEIAAVTVEHVSDLRVEQEEAVQQTPGPAEPPSADMSVHVPVALLAQPLKPKKAASAWWLFSCGLRDEVAKELEAQTGVKAKFGEIGKLLAARWGALSEQDRKVWDDKAADDKLRCEREMRTFLEGRDPAGALRLKYSHLIPKKPLSSFGLYCQSQISKEKAAAALKADGKEPSSRLIMAKMGEIWKSSGVEETGPFQEQQLTEHLAYIEQQKVWQTTPECAELEKVTKEQEVLKKALEVVKANEEAARIQRDAREKKMAKTAARKRVSEGAKETTPAKRTRAGQSSTPDAKVPRGKTAEIGPSLDQKVLAEAAKCGLEAGFRNLASRPEVMSSGKSAKAVLDALRSCSGLVNPAKRALLGQ